eukprot:94456_1
MTDNKMNHSDSDDNVLIGMPHRDTVGLPHTDDTKQDIQYDEEKNIESIIPLFGAHSEIPDDDSARSNLLLHATCEELDTILDSVPSELIYSHNVDNVDGQVDNDIQIPIKRPDHDLIPYFDKELVLYCNQWVNADKIMSIIYRWSEYQDIIQRNKPEKQYNFGYMY